MVYLDHGRLLDISLIFASISFRFYVSGVLAKIFGFSLSGLLWFPLVFRGCVNPI